ncbi:MAG TPA: GNAT family N-acetyltransferase [Thermoanaerobaculia bacterium]
MSAAAVAPRATLRDIVPADLARVVEIDSRHRGAALPDYWRGVRDAFLAGGREHVRVALGAEVEGRLAGFLFGEVRAFEFGSEPCGWIFAVGVDGDAQRSGLGSALLAEACRRFHAAGITKIRTMVRRADVPVLAFFRAHGFAAGEFTQLELELPTEGR